MLRSMTGFGVGEAMAAGWRAAATVRTLNHRFISVRVRSLHDQPELQTQVDEAVKRAFRRGEIDVWITLERTQEAQAYRLFDREAVREHLDELRSLATDLDLPDPPTLADLTRVGAFRQVADPGAGAWAAVEPALREAIEAAVRARETEGAHLARELALLLDGFGRLLETVEARLPEITEELRARMRDRIAELRTEVDPVRLEQEVVLLAERSDVREEVARLRGHLARARSLLTSAVTPGKELDFLAQEFLREVNTLGAKSRDLSTSSLVVEMKVAVERWKEQVQNVE